MSAILTELNLRYPNNLERLMAASSKIIQLEEIIKAGENLEQARKTEVEALVAICDATMAMLKVARPLFPEMCLDQLDALLIRADQCLSLVKESS